MLFFNKENINSKRFYGQVDEPMNYNHGFYLLFYFEKKLPVCTLIVLELNTVRYTFLIV